MKSRLIALVTATALAATSMTANPAVARDNKDQRTLAIILGALAVGAIIANENQKQRAPVYAPPSPPPQRQSDWHHRRDEWRDRPVIPATCVDEVRTRDGRRAVVSRGCLQDFGLLRRMPSECAFDVRTRYGTRPVFGRQCLVDRGFRIEGARY